MKIITTNGITYLELLDGNTEWYWGSDYAAGDLYEAEELYRNNHPITCNRLVFVRYPDGFVVEPIKGREGQYFGRPIFYDGSIRILLVDFPQSLICIFQYDISTGKVTQTVSLPLAMVDDCYNLMFGQSPLMLIRQGSDKKFQIVWPEKAEIDMSDTESFMERNGDMLYFCRWFEQPDYQEEIVVRNLSGEIIEIIPGSWREMPDGQIWVLR